MKNRIGIIIAVVSPLIISYCLISSGCQPSHGYITVDSRSGLTQPTFCLYRDASFQEPWDITGIIVWKVHEKQPEVDSQWVDRQMVWDLDYVETQATSPLSCLTYGEVPLGYQENLKAVPLEPEQLYTFFIGGPGGVDAEELDFIIRLNNKGIPERLESH